MLHIGANNIVACKIAAIIKSATFMLLLSAAVQDLVLRQRGYLLLCLPTIAAE